MHNIEIQKNTSLAEHTTFKIGGLAKYFVLTESIDDLVEAIGFAQNKKLPFFILGGGSNILANDNGFDGIIIKIQNAKYEIRDAKILAETGVNFWELVAASVKNGLADLEWAVGIPGTIGGAVRGNAGAFGFSISKSVIGVQALRLSLRGASQYCGTTKQSHSVINYKTKDCRFGYRDSIFKRNKDIILSVELQLKKGKKEKSRKILNDYLKQKKENQPLEYLSAGCIFKNPPGQFAGQMIEECGLKGKQIGQAMISKKHANFIVNLGNAKSKDVEKLIQTSKEAVREKFGIDLEEEIQYLGF